MAHISLFKQKLRDSKSYKTELERELKYRSVYNSFHLLIKEISDSYAVTISIGERRDLAVIRTTKDGRDCGTIEITERLDMTLKMGGGVDEFVVLKDGWHEDANMCSALIELLGSRFKPRVLDMDAFK